MESFSDYEDDYEDYAAPSVGHHLQILASTGHGNSDLYASDDNDHYESKYRDYQSPHHHDPIEDWEDDQQDLYFPTRPQLAYAPYTQNAPFLPTINRSQPSQNLQPNQSWQRPPNQFSAQNQSASLLLPIQRKDTPRNVHGIRLRPVSDLPDIYRGLFKFGVFNAVQSSCFDTVLHSAPTGSGKTVLFELSIIRMLQESKETGEPLKAIYVAPTKALCSERFRDWVMKFEPLGIKCAELTGDTVVFGRGAWGEAKNASIIVTTSEKWDSLTRNWFSDFYPYLCLSLCNLYRDESRAILNQICLFLVDEVHILNESRGSVLEVIVSRMRLRGNNVRFVTISATVPNIQDIAAWIKLNSQSDTPAKVFEFGEEFRPCKLTRHVVAVPRSKQANDFVFNRHLDFKLFGTLQKYSSGKPILVFVSTRKGTIQSAEQLKKEFEETEMKKGDLPWTRPPKISHLKWEYVDLASVGIGVHHAGLQLEDRKAVEDLYLRRVLRIVTATSTLAVGVNLPAHTVVIKGVMMFQDGAMVEYSDLDIMQMLGRAGRPQFDNEGVAIILCSTDLEAKYVALSQGRTILESNLHINLVEHLNSEIGLGTVAHIESAKTWLRQSFLFQRIKKNPRHYQIAGRLEDDDDTWEETVDDMVLRSIKKLKETELVEVEGEKLKVTEYGDIMSRFYIRQATMCKILDLPEKAGLKELLMLLSSCEEVTVSMLRGSEKSPLGILRVHPEIRFPPQRVECTPDKMSLLIQAQLACINLSTPEFKCSDSQLSFEAFSAFRHLPRIMRAIVEVATTRRIGSHMKYGLELLRSVTAKAWDDRPYVFRQLDSIGEKSIKILGEHDIATIARLRTQDPLRLENASICSHLLGRRPPFGHDVLNSLRELPHYRIAITEKATRSSSNGKDPVEVDLVIDCGLVEETLAALKTNKKKFKSGSMTNILTLTSDLDFIDFRRIGTKHLTEGKSFRLDGVGLMRPSQSVVVYMSADNVAGVTVTANYQPTIPSTYYPTPDTRPISTEVDSFVSFTLMYPNPGTLTTSAPKTSVTKAKENSEESLKRPDGNYRINQRVAIYGSSPSFAGKWAHSCSCREGLSVPPKRRGGKEVNWKTSDHWQIKAAKSPQGSFAHLVKNEPKLSTRQETLQGKDTTLEDLEDLHRRTDVSGSIKLPTGKRIKVDVGLKTLPLGSPSRVRKKLPPADFSITLSTLPMDKPNSRFTVPDILEGDDDELPDPDAMVSGRASVLTSSPPRNATDYDDVMSDSDLDQLMQDLPQEAISRALSPSPRKITAVSHGQSSVRSSTLKRKASSPASLECGPGNPGLSKCFNAHAPEHHFQPLKISIPRNSPLFVSSSDDEVQIVEKQPITPPFAARALPEEKVSQGMENEEDEQEDEFAELEKWLYSGAVKIIE
ncbi:ATP-dependent DNA helicase MER3 [Flagelloscypha sp. PMI_526]|nr:ATP-dependent DNA helicase MER3 [Flagelloscypha sp. PMI_526]